jgi:hypothetical protein
MLIALFMKVDRWILLRYPGSRFARSPFIVSVANPKCTVTVSASAAAELASIARLHSLIGLLPKGKMGANGEPTAVGINSPSLSMPSLSMAVNLIGRTNS